MLVFEFKARVKPEQAAVAVPPNNTSQNCSSCGKTVKKSLSTRTHICPHCGYGSDRDVSPKVPPLAGAAINILQLGLSRARHTQTHTLGEFDPLVSLEQSWEVTVG